MMVYIGLGSNLSNPMQQLKTAVEHLVNHTAIDKIALSPCFMTQPMGSNVQPVFYNAVLQVNIRITLWELLSYCQGIEQLQQRQRLKKWGPRTIDLDLLVAEATVIHDPKLRLPHPGIAQRDFVIEPLKCLSPNLQIPGLGCVSRLVVTERHIIDQVSWSTCQLVSASS